MATATPNNDRSTHHIVLTQATKSVGLILCDPDGSKNKRAFRRDPLPQSSLKTYSGPQKYADMEAPWTPLVQSDWAGGRGLDDADLDASRYYDGWRADTNRSGQIILGGLHTYSTGLRTNLDDNWVHRNNEYARIPPALYIAMPFTPSASYTITQLYLILRKPALDGGTLTITFRADSAGSPSTVLSTINVTEADFETEVWTEKIFTANQAVTAGTQYWVVVYNDEGRWLVLCEKMTSGGVLKTSVAGSTWAAATEYALCFRASGAEVPYKAHFAELKGALFAALTYDAGTVSKLFINGDQGVATGGDTGGLDDSTKSAVWVADEFKGCLLRLIIGAGSAQTQTWRLITSNTTTRLNVTDLWQVAPAAGTEYVIIAADRWREVTGHSWTTQTVTDILSANNILYFAHGETLDMSRLRRYNSSGWTNNWVTETNNKATYLAAASDQDGGAIWKCNPPANISRATAVNGSGGSAAANLTFATAITVGDFAERIRNMLVYGEYGNLWILKEGSFWQIVNGKPYLVPIQEMSVVDDERNGAAATMHNVYLYSSFHDGILRYFDRSLDSIGPNIDVGIPSDRQGPVSCLTGYPGLVIASIDAGADGYSSVLGYNGQGWYEIYRAPAVGLRIRSLYIQPIPGNHVDRLWINCGSDILWVPLSIDPYRHPYVSYNHYRYWVESHVITAWFYANLYDVSKYFNSLKVIGEIGADVGLWIDYKLDSDTNWTNLGLEMTNSLNTQQSFDTSHNTGKRIQLRLRLQTESVIETPRLLATVIEAVTRVPVKHSVTITFRVADDDWDINGDPDAQSADTKLDQLEEWAQAAYPVTVTSMISVLHNTTAFVDPASIRMLGKVKEEGRESYIGQLTLIQV